MISRAFRSLLLLPVALRAVMAQTACNNSPDLCNNTYNNITYLGAHDSPFVRDDSTGWTSSGNQFYNSTIQLQAGVRLLTGQVHLTNSTDSGELHLCHSSCSLLDAGKLSDWLGEIKAFMDDEPNEVVTVLLVNSDDAGAADLGAEYEAAALADYSYQPSTTSTANDWPTLQSLIKNGTRLVNFVASLDDNSAAPYLMSGFDYIFENSYENTASTSFNCTADRPSSINGQTSAAVDAGYMSLMNHFLNASQAFGIQTPDTGNLTTTNAAGNQTGALGQSARQCRSEYEKAPNFLLVDFFNVGPAIDTVDSLNGVSNSTGRTSVSNEVLAASSAARMSPRFVGFWPIGVLALSIACGFC